MSDNGCAETYRSAFFCSGNKDGILYFENFKLFKA